MLLSKLFVPSAYFLILQPVLATPVDLDARDLELAVEIDANSVILVDAPELLPSDGTNEKRDAEPLQDLEPRDELEPRASLSADQKKAFSLHNTARLKKHKVKLIWDNKLAADALVYAKQMAKSGKFAHSSASSRKGQGENLAYQWSTGKVTNPISQGTQRWINEEKYYKNQPIPKGDFAAYGHYTQIMWKKSTRVGIATASNGKGGWYSVARYSPAGNIGGQKPY